jgi:TatD DNase family protein
VPHRGKRNEPAWVRLVAEQVARVLGRPVEDVVAATGATARRVFGERLAAGAPPAP